MHAARRERLLVIQHDADKGLGLLAEPLQEAFDLDVRFAGRDGLAVEDHLGVVALPGLADPVDETTAVAETRDVLTDALARELPILGICLGAELLAEAAGGGTHPCEPEYGYCSVTLTNAASADPLLAELPTEFDAFQAHGYAIDLPDRATALAESPRALQAFRLGDRVWGIQFHPEPTLTMLASWIETIRGHMERSGIRPADVAARAQEIASPSAVRAARIATGFAAAVRCAVA